MALFISGLSLFILVLFNSCFALPLVDEQLSSSTFSSMGDDLTTKKLFNLPWVSDNENSTSSNMDKKYLSSEHPEFDVTTSVHNSSEENILQVLRKFDELFPSETTKFTPKQSSTTITTTTELPELGKRVTESEEEPEEVTESEPESNHNERDITVEFPKNNTLLSTSTSSNFVPELSTLGLSISSSTKKIYWSS
jgi:hypothetical protein